MLRGYIGKVMSDIILIIVIIFKIGLMNILVEFYV